MDEGVEQVTNGLEAPVREIVNRLRTLVVNAVPDGIEEADPAAKLLGYTFKPGTYKYLIAAIAPQTRHVNLMFASGAELAEEDTEGLLEGTGKRARHIKFHTPADVDRAGVVDLLSEAARRTPRP
ncbi:DUF1801 domain-containing protein [Pseudactinotalea sp. Z1732]|uniref:DUF1801 domain-containing protein n=1 Tax=Micrococcales TaxID=85006 RepID=UPI003C7EB190